ncbi:hypothetical protein FNU77_08610 [Prescottella equi]|nr:hypothetical protein FNU77_08610 [Prescottella equi]
MQWCSGAVVQWCSGAVVQWCSGAVVQWCSGAVVQWCSGAVVGLSCGRLSIGLQSSEGEMFLAPCLYNRQGANWLGIRS